jgi:hypothetical protein
MKMNKIVVIFILFLFVSCVSKEDKEKSLIIKEDLQMYIPSELALLMEEMYHYNDSIKGLIEQGIIPRQQFPEKFLKIHTAEMTNTFERGEPFKKYANTFTYSQNEILNSNSENIQENFNTMINLCIGCHQTSCTGPIPRIKKLLIKQ